MSHCWVILSTFLSMIQVWQERLCCWGTSYLKCTITQWSCNLIQSKHQNVSDVHAVLLYFFSGFWSIIEKNRYYAQTHFLKKDLRMGVPKKVYISRPPEHENVMFINNVRMGDFLAHVVERYFDVILMKHGIWNRSV